MSTRSCLTCGTPLDGAQDNRCRRDDCSRQRTRQRAQDCKDAALAARRDERCAVCRGPLGSVDHYHATGRLRGALCHRCSAGLGMFGDDPQRLLTAARYVFGLQASGQSPRGTSVVFTHVTATAAVHWDVLLADAAPRGTR